MVTPDALYKELEHTWDLMLSNAPEAIKILNRLLEQNSGDIAIQAECDFQMGWAFAYKGENEASIEYFQSAIALFEQINNQEKKVRSLNGLGSAYVELSLYQSALTVYNKALTLASELKQPLLTIPIHINLAAIHCELSNFKIAKERLETLESVITKHQLEPVIASDNLAIFHNLYAMTAWDEGNTEQFIYHLDRSKQIATEGHCSGALFVSNIFRIRLSVSNNRYQEAAQSYQALLEQNTLQDVGIEYFRGLAEFAALLNEGQEYDKIIRFLKPVLSQVTGTYYSFSTIRAKELLAQSYAKTGAYQPAYQELEQLNTAKEWTDNAETQQQLLLINQSSQISQLERKAANEKQLRHEMEQMNKRYQIVNRIGRNISASLDLKTIINSLFSSLKQIAKISNIAFGYYSEEHNHLAFEYGVDMGKELAPFYIPLNRQQSTSVRTFQRQEITLLNEKQLAQLSVIGEGEPILSAIFVPISYNNQKLGILTIQSIHKNVFDPLFVNILKDIANYLFISIKNGWNHQEMVQQSKQLHQEKEQLTLAKSDIEVLANHDELTQLPNRTYLQQRLQKQIAASAGKSRFSFIYFNLNQFKKINYDYGYVIGDQLLTEFSHIVKENLAVGDFFARIGSDEFVVISRIEHWYTDTENTIRFFHNQIQESIIIADMTYRLSARLGIAHYPSNGASFDELMSVAECQCE